MPIRVCGRRPYFSSYFDKICQKVSTFEPGPLNRSWRTLWMAAQWVFLGRWRQLAGQMLTH